MEDLEAESLLWSDVSSVSIPLPTLMPFTLSPDQSVMYSDSLLLQMLSVDQQHGHKFLITWELVEMQVSGRTPDPLTQNLLLPGYPGDS